MFGTENRQIIPLSADKPGARPYKIWDVLAEDVGHYWRAVWAYQAVGCGKIATGLVPYPDSSGRSVLVLTGEGSCLPMELVEALAGVSYRLEQKGASAEETRITLWDEARQMAVFQAQLSICEQSIPAAIDGNPKSVEHKVPVVIRQSELML